MGAAGTVGRRFQAEAFLGHLGQLLYSQPYPSFSGCFVIWGDERRKT